MKRLLALVLALLLSCASVPAFATPDSPSPDNPVIGSSEDARTLGELLQANAYTEGRVLARVNSEFAPIATYSNDAAWTMQDMYFFAPNPAAASTRSRAAAPVDKVVLIESSTLSTEELLRSLADTPGVLMAEPDYLFQLEEPASSPTPDAAPLALPPEQATTNDPFLEKQWQLDSTALTTGGTNARELWHTLGIPENEANLDEVVVAVADSGVDYTNPDLTDVMWNNPTGNGGDHGYDFINDDDDPLDENGHGTHVAGIIAASINNNEGGAGIAPNAKIMALRIGSNDGFPTSATIFAYEYLADLVDSGVHVVAVNNSWGGTGASILVTSVMDDLYHKYGVASICASGNDTLDNDLIPIYPAGLPTEGIITVNAVDTNGALSDFSCYGASTTDIAAPGVDILSTVPKENGSVDPSKTETILLREEFNTATGLFAFKKGGDATTNVEYAENVGAGSNPSEGSLLWTIHEAHKDQVTELILTSPEGAAKKALDANGASPSKVQYLGFDAKVNDSLNTGRSRKIGVFVKSLDPNNPWIELKGKEDTGIKYGKWGSNAVPFTDEQKNLVDWDNFSIKIVRTLASIEEGANLTIGVDNVSLVTDLIPYTSYSGTSMAAPVVTGAYALIAGMFPNEDPATWRARILGGVSRVPALWGTCTSDGSIDLMRAAGKSADPYPVVDALEAAQDGSRSATVRGSWFGNQAGRVLLDDKELTVTSWAPDKIEVVLPASLAAERHYVQVERENGETGRRAVALSRGEETLRYEDLPAPSLEELGLILTEQNSGWKLEPAAGKLYATVIGLQHSDDGSLFDGLLVFDPQSKTWEIEEASKGILTGDMIMTSYNNIVYALSTDSSFTLRSYDPATQTPSDPLDCTSSLSALGYLPEFGYFCSLACDGQFIWITGGVSKGEVLSKVVRLDIKTGQATDVTPLMQARVEPTSRFVQGELFVAAGDKATGAFVDSLERLQGDTWVSYSLPDNLAPTQSGSLASATLPAGAVIAGTSTLNERLILAGLTTSDLSGSDTYVFDPATGAWQVVPERLSVAKIGYIGSALLDTAFYVLGQETAADQTVFRRLSFELAPAGPGTEEKPGQTGDPTGDTGSGGGQDQLANPDKLAPTGDASAGAVLALVVAVATSGAVCAGVRSRIRRRVR